MTYPAYTDEGWTGTSETGLADLLSEIVTPEIYRKNPFRVVGLPATATTRAIATQVQKLQVLADLGGTNPDLAGPYPIKPPPTAEEIRAAERELHDPLRRIIYELFWFWPLDGVDGGQDPGFLALKARDISTAQKLWADVDKDPQKGPIAHHNNAVRYHLMALGYERHGARTSSEAKTLEALNRAWELSFLFWDRSITNDATWGALSARVLALDDHRLSLEAVQDLRIKAARAIAGINIELALRQLKDGRIDAAKTLIALITNPSLRAFDPAENARAAIARIKTELSAVLKAKDIGRQGNESNGLKIAQELIDPIKLYWPILERLAVDTTDDSWRSLIDRMIRTANGYAIDYDAKTDDSKRFISALREALPFITGLDLKELVEGNIRVGIGKLAAHAVAPQLDLLKSVLESSEEPPMRLWWITSRVIPSIPHVEATLAEIGHPTDEFFNYLALVLRDVSIKAWNDKKDIKTAKKAIELGARYVRDKETQKQIYDDVVMVNGFAAQHKKALIKKRIGYALAAAFGLYVIIGALLDTENNNPSAPPSHEAATPAPGPTLREQASPSRSLQDSQIPPPGPTDAAPSTSPQTGGQGDTFEVPSDRLAELDADRTAAADAMSKEHELDSQVTQDKTRLTSQEAELETLESAVKELGDAIDEERASVDATDNTIVATFNQRVQTYNAKLARYKAMLAEYNRHVTSHNDLVESARSQERIAQRLIDAYNSKLEQYGTRQ